MRAELSVAPRVIPLLASLKCVRRLMFRTISQTTIHYRDSRLRVGVAGRVRGGDRLPWVPLHGVDDNFTPLASLDWQLHVYGSATAEIAEVCQRRLALCVFPWEGAMQRAGLRRDAAYLVRPDGHVGLADPAARAATLAGVS